MALLFAALVLAAAPASAKMLTHDELVALYGRAAPPTQPVVLRTPKDASGTLRDAAAAKGIFIGSALSMQGLTNASAPQYNATAMTQFNLMTSDNACKFQPTENTYGQFTIEECTAGAKWSAASGLVHRLHNLVWGQQLPRYITNPSAPWQPDALLAAVTEHINHMVKAYTPGGSENLPAYCTDAVNEPFADGNNASEIFKPVNPWYPTLPDYVAQAVTIAKAAAGGSPLKLFINEYGAEGKSSMKAQKVLATAAALLKRGVPLDGIGLQMHISVDAYPTAADVSANMADLVALGLEVHVTEMDVRCPLPCGSDRLALQAKIYGDLLQACLDNSKPTNPNGKGGCKSFETWGFTDLDTWIWTFENPTHANLQPLPWDINFAPKPAFYEMLAVLQA